MLSRNVRLLRSRYKLVAGPVHDESISQAWLGVDEDDNKPPDTASLDFRPSRRSIKAS